MYANKIDKNQNEIVNNLRSIGFSVWLTNGKQGKPDMVVAYQGKTAVVEVKTTTGKQRPAQKEFQLNWKGWYILARSTEDIINFWGIK